MCIWPFKKKTVAPIPDPTPVPAPDPVPVVRQQVTGDFVFQILNSKFPNVSHIYLSDSTYWLCSEADIQNFLALDQTNKLPYVAEEFDCDDFSYRLMGQLSVPNWSGIAFGIVWTDKHALNCLIDSDGKFWFVEPQTNILTEKLDTWQGSDVLFILM